MEDLILLICRIFGMIAAGFGLWFGAISACFLLREKPLPEPDRPKRFAVLIPARNEESCIAGIIESLQKQDYPQELIDIYVIPNNCTDSTAAVALQAGANIMTVSARVNSKGMALSEAFSMLLKTNKHDAYCVFDADNEVNPMFLAEMNRYLSRFRAAKSRIFAKNSHESWVCACYETYFCNANLLLNRPRQRLGLSARLIGTGFSVRRDLMEELGGWHTNTLTEDADFYAMLASRGERVAFVPQAITYDEEPLTFRESIIQRRRWMSGIMEVCRNRAGQLIRGIFSGTGGLRAADAFLQLTFAHIQAWLLPMFLLQLAADPLVTLQTLPYSALSYYASTLLIGAVSLLWERRMTRYKALCLLLYPLFIVSFLPLQTLSLFLPNKKWKPIRHSGVRLPESTIRSQ